MLVGMGETVFQIVSLGVLLLVIARFARQQRKTCTLPLRKYWPFYVFWAWCIGCFAYGIIFYVDAPFHENAAEASCGDVPYCGKTGRPHTQEEYDAFLDWQDMFFVSAMTGFLAGIVAWAISISKKP